MLNRRLSLGIFAIFWLHVSPTWPDSTKKSIFFGDLHTHSNLSADAMLMQLAHGTDRGPEAACEYALACAQVDFYGQSDHAEMLDAAAWQRSQTAVKNCNAKGAALGSGTEPSIVAFQGFEWTSSGKDLYWGHKNVFFRNDLVPDLPVAAYSIRELGVADPTALLHTMAIYNRIGVSVGPALNSIRRAAKINRLKECRDGKRERCLSVAPTPKDLWHILNSYFAIPSYRDGGYDTLAIPHGTAWGMAKVGTNWDIQIDNEQHDPNLQRIIEVYSGHGNSENYRDYSAPNSAYESCYDRAAKLQALYCRKNNEAFQTCKTKIAQALETGKVPFRTQAGDWGQCAQCQDCFQPAERYDPDGSVQAALAKTGFNADGTRTRYQFGFIAATDDHASRPASVMESRALADWGLAVFFQATVGSAFAPEGRNDRESERVASYLYPGGLVAIHAEARTRESLWDALKRREVYGTSGPRMSLWFTAATPLTSVTMGDRLASRTSPAFEFEVWGGPEELPGCSAATRERWGEGTVNDICLNVCYNPGNRRIGIDRVEVIRITPQITQDEKLSALIEDPYLTIRNENLDRQGLPSPMFKGSFSDPEFARLERDAIYYIRAIQAPTPAVNGQPMRRVDNKFETCPLYYDGDDCISMAEERAWSSPIYVDFTAATKASAE